MDFFICNVSACILSLMAWHGMVWYTCVFIKEKTPKITIKLSNHYSKHSTNVPHIPNSHHSPPKLCILHSKVNEMGRKLRAGCTADVLGSTGSIHLLSPRGVGDTWQCETHGGSVALFPYLDTNSWVSDAPHDGVIAWKHFPHHWPFSSFLSKMYRYVNRWCFLWC